MFAAILILGFNPRHSLFTNKVSRLADASGIRFQKYGIAYTEPFETEIRGRVPEQDGFSLEIAFRSDHRRKNGFGIIFMFHDGNDGSQLLMGQWRSHIIVMNGDDYDHRRNIPRISTNTAGMPSKTIVATVTTGRGGTRLYLNGRFVLERKNLSLTIPDGGRHTRLIIGNSVYGSNPWEGDIYGFAVYPFPLASADVSNHYERWLKNRDFSFGLDDCPNLLYLFDEAGGKGVLERTNGSNPLEIPSWMTVLKRRTLAFSPEKFHFNAGNIQDIIINFLGFIPFGWILASTLCRLREPYKKYAVLITVIMGFFVSLAIEVGQSWIPSRSSSLLDLVLNTAGTGLGAVSRGMVFRKLRI